MLILLGCAALLAQSRVRIVVISFLSHRVQVQKPGESGAPQRWQMALLSAPVTEGEAIRTHFNGEAEVELECGSALRLAPESEMTMTRLRLSKNGVPATTVSVSRGEAFFSLRDEDSHDFHVLLPGAELSLPSGGARMRLDVPAGKPASVEVLGGHVQVRGSKSPDLVASSHQRIELLPGGGFRRLAELAPDAWQKWSKSRDDQFQRALMLSAPQPPSIDVGSAQPIATTPPTVPNPLNQLPLLQNLGSSLPGGPPPGFRQPVPPKVPACARG